MRLALVSCLIVLSGCSLFERVLPDRASQGADVIVQTPDRTTPRPRARPDGGGVPQAAVSGASLGTTIAALGDPTQAGLWLRTPLVGAEASGIVTYRGQSVAVTLLPIPDAAQGAGSQLSFEAMRSLGAPLTELIEIGVEAL